MPRPEAGRRAWLWFLPVAALLLGRLVQPWIEPLGDPDFWWLSWFGERWLHGVMPVTNGFSWTAPDMAWITHEPGVGLIDALAGPAHIGLVRGLMLGLTWLILAQAAWTPRGGYALPLALAWSMSLVDWGISERALSWGNLMLAIVVALTTPARMLADSRTPLIGKGGVPAWRMAGATLAVGVWANLHGSFPIGILLVALADWRWALAAAGITLLNPHGLQIWGLLYRYGPQAEVGRFLAGHVPEWRSLSLGRPGDLLSIFLLLAAFPLIWPLRMRAMVLWIGFTVMALCHARFTDFTGIALLPWVSAGLARRLPPLRAISPLPLGGMALALCALLLPAPRFEQGRYPMTFPVRFLEGHRVWNEYQLGGFLGERGALVFWDPRVDCYPVSILQDGTDIEWSDAKRPALLDRWRIDRVVAWSPHILDPLERAGWREVMRKGDVRVLGRPPVQTGS